MYSKYKLTQSEATALLQFLNSNSVTWVNIHPTVDGGYEIREEEVERYEFCPSYILTYPVEGGDSVPVKADTEYIMQQVFSDPLFLNSKIIPTFTLYSMTFVEDVGNNWYTPPTGIDFRKLENGQLFPNEVYVKGELTCVDWYDNEAEAGQPIVKEVFTYVRNSEAWALWRNEDRSWLLSDGTYWQAPTKKKIYYKDPAAMTKEGSDRRQRIHDRELAIISGFLISSGVLPAETAKEQGQQFLAKYMNTLAEFVVSSSDKILTELADDKEFMWLGAEMQPGLSVRQYLINQFNIWES